MPVEYAKNRGNSGAEEEFIQLFCDLFGPEKGEYVYLQYPFLDIYGKHRTIDFAIRSKDGKIAFEIDGETWHNPSKVSEDKYTDDLLKQNSMVFDGWKVYRWTDTQISKTPERVKDELVTFLGASPRLLSIDDTMPVQQGKVFSLMEHQEEALEALSEMRRNNQTIALVQGATGSGKTAIGVLDAKKVGKRTLFLAHRNELLTQAADTFQKLWPEVSTGLYVDSSREMDTFVVCATVQGLQRNLEQFSPDDFGYLIIDECHHASAASYQKILGYFHTDFTLGLTATPERADGEDLLETFQTMAHHLDIKEAVETGVLCPVRCIRVKTNIDLRDVRINGFKYNSLDLESKIRVPERNQLIVDTYNEYVHGKSAVVFCTSVRHAEEIAARFNEDNVEARAVSGRINAVQRKRILGDFAEKKIQVLCACDLLNEGWDCPQTEVLFMARPTLSRTIYMQQLGRGMRKHPGKECLMVFDFVDNANLFNCAYSMHRILNVSEYVPGGLVLGKKSDIQWDKDMFAKGEKPEALLDYPIYATDYEVIDLLNWQEEAKGMLSQLELTQRVSAQGETIANYIKKGKIIPDLQVPVGTGKYFNYFKKSRVKEYCKQFNWKEITRANKKEMFLEMARQMTMSYSYKPVFINAFFNYMNRDGEAILADVAQEFAAFYEDRAEKGLPAEKKTCIFTKGGYTQKDVERLILSMPFKRFESMGFMHHSKHIGIIKLDKHIKENLTDEDICRLQEYCESAVERYFQE